MAAPPREIFAPLGPTYERAGRLLSLGLEAGWRARLAETAAPADGQRILDVATGTGLVARALRDRAACVVFGLDVTPQMLRSARPSAGIHYVAARAERLPFADGGFDGLTFTYLLRYVADPPSTIRELARVVRPGGRITSLEFYRPGPWPLRLGWWLYTRIALPLIGRALSREWSSVGSFLGRSISGFYDRHSLREVEAMWREAGIKDVRSEVLGLGAAVVTTGIRSNSMRSAPLEVADARPALIGTPTERDPASASARPAFYALAQGGWRDYVTLLHPPYTAWHLSYVALGAALAPTLHLDRLVGTLLAFFLALGIGVHALDELSGRPLRTRIPKTVLLGLGVGGVAAAVALGLVATTVVGSSLLIFITAGVLLALGYPLELARGRLHGDLWFALGWGAFPVLTAYWANAVSLSWGALAAAAYAFTLSYAQRRLSTWVRTIRRRTLAAEGRLSFTDGGTQRLDERALIAPAESALRWLTAASVLVALAALSARLLA